MLIKAQTRIGSGVQYDLGNKDDLFVGKSVTVRSFDANAVVTSGNGQAVTVAGLVMSVAETMDLEGNRQTVRINAGGIVISEEDIAVHIAGLNGTVINRGNVQGEIGVYIDDAGGGTASITNFGTISGNTGIFVDDPQETVLRNFGFINSSLITSFSGGALRDVVLNAGTMRGDILLNDGNDLYDGRAGKLIDAVVYGGNGNDTFRPGAQAERFVGGLDTDTVDYRSARAVKVDLSGVLENTGFARGDIFMTVERLFGSATGADALRGDINAEDIRGFGGRDRISGAAGEDSLHGGAGRDILTGGSENDQFYFESLKGAGDRITDFAVAEDLIYIRAAAFGGGLGPGVLSAGRFTSVTTNQAGDANDRFIFRTGDETLWFDRDGNRNAFKPVMIADLQDGAAFSEAGIFLY